MNILGISAYYHDSAACLVVDGKIIAAAQEERFTRKKHDENFPANAINYCLTEARLSAQQIDYVVFYDKPFLKFERLFETYLAFAPKGFKSFATSLCRVVYLLSKVCVGCCKVLYFELCCKSCVKVCKVCRLVKFFKNVELYLCAYSL